MSKTLDFIKESFEYELEDELDCIMDNPDLSDEQKNNKIAKLLNSKKYKNEELCEDAAFDEVQIRKKLHDYIENVLTNVEGTDLVCNEVEGKVPGYNADWCSDEGQSIVLDRYYNIREKFILAMVEIYLENM